jgi:hypothetical protein
VAQLLRDKRSHQAICTAELYADGFAADLELSRANRAADQAWEKIAHGSTRTPYGGGRAAEAAWNTSNEDPFEAALLVSDNARDAAGEAADPEILNREKEGVVQAAILRDIVGPFRTPVVPPAWVLWNDATVRKIAQTIYDERAFERLPILADALEDAACDNADILNHCRQPGVHVRGCWVVDLLLGKE